MVISTNHLTLWMLAGTSSTDTTNPTVGDIQVGGAVVNGQTITDQTPEFTASISDDTGINTSSITFVIDDGAAVSGNDITFTGGQFSYTSPTLSLGSHSVTLSVEDTAGNADVSTATFTLSESFIEGNVYNYPNPVRSGYTTIHFELDAVKEVKIYIYNAVGELVNYQVVNGSIGDNDWVWGVDDAYGNTVANGIYFIHVLAGDTLVGKAKALVIK